MFEEIPYEEKVKQYALFELNDILHQIDRQHFPERYQLVAEEIERRKATQPQASSAARPHETAPGKTSIAAMLSDLIQPVSGKKAVRVEYTNAWYFWSLLLFVTVLLIFNILPLIDLENTAQRVPRLIAAFLQAGVILFSLMKRPAALFFTRFWASLQVLALLLLLTLFTGAEMTFLTALIGIPDVLTDLWSEGNTYLIITVVFHTLLGLAYCALTDVCVRPVFEE